MSEKLFIDDDWKREAEQEKLQASQKLDEPKPAAKAATNDPGVPPGPGSAEDGLNETDGPTDVGFPLLLDQMALQAAAAMGMLADPRTGRPLPVNLDAARLHIDLLGVLQEKTKGNLTDAEQTLMAQTLQTLRLRYVQLMNAVSDAVTRGATKLGPDTVGAGKNLPPISPVPPRK